MDPILKERRKLICEKLLAGWTVVKLAQVIGDPPDAVRSCVIQIFETHGFNKSLNAIYKEFYKN